MLWKSTRYNFPIRRRRATSRIFRWTGKAVSQPSFVNMRHNDKARKRGAKRGNPASKETKERAHHNRHAATLERKETPSQGTTRHGMLGSLAKPANGGKTGSYPAPAPPAKEDRKLHGRDGCERWADPVGKASRAETVFRLAATALQFC